MKMDRHAQKEMNKKAQQKAKNFLNLIFTPVLYF